ncbi:CLUMA_CG009444, isoform A [Clunio marinus]|uniref:CLUMA_CG009444, isoform A n=1 Tax=Clunio marinus TaxID=568069 RepID=A0A1J1I8V9_9DIPT|nr:CLUMA_CG009444, isoform A [Clunio marinus]
MPSFIHVFVHYHKLDFSFNKIAFFPLESLEKYFYGVYLILIADNLRFPVVHDISDTHTV